MYHEIQSKFFYETKVTLLINRAGCLAINTVGIYQYMCFVMLIPNLKSNVVSRNEKVPIY